MALLIESMYGERAIKFARQFGYGYISRYTNDQLAAKHNLSVKVIAMARELSHDMQADVNEQFNRSGFSGSKS